MKRERVPAILVVTRKAGGKVRKVRIKVGVHFFRRIGRDVPWEAEVHGINAQLFKEFHQAIQLINHLVIYGQSYGHFAFVQALLLHIQQQLYGVNHFFERAFAPNRVILLLNPPG